MTRRHTHTYRPSLTLTLTLPDSDGAYAVVQVWRCACGVGMDLASDVQRHDRLPTATQALVAIAGEMVARPTRTVHKTRIRTRI